MHQPEENMKPLRFLIIDDSPGRYEEFTRLLDDKGHYWTITSEFSVARHLVAAVEFGLTFDVVILDHDMPRMNGVEWAKNIISEKWDMPVVITSTTSKPNARETMLDILMNGGIPAVIIPADHMNCEIEWLSWSQGAVTALDSVNTSDNIYD